MAKQLGGGSDARKRAPARARRGAGKGSGAVGHLVPIVDDTGTLIGIVSINDLALAATEAEADGGITEHEVADLLRTVCAPRSAATGDLRVDRGSSNSPAVTFA